MVIKSERLRQETGLFQSELKVRYNEPGKTNLQYVEAELATDSRGGRSLRDSNNHATDFIEV